MFELLYFTFEHMMIVLTATMIAIVLGVGFGILAYWVKFFDMIILWTADILQMIPSLALLAILMLFFGLGNATIIAGLVVYSLLPIIRNTYIGLNGVPSYIKDAAKGMGMSKVQRLFKVELPQAFPLIFSGIKIAVVTSISIAVIGVLIGAGGLGHLVYRGIQTRNYAQIVSGGAPAVLLAVIFNFIMTRIESKLTNQ